MRDVAYEPRPGFPALTSQGLSGWFHRGVTRDPLAFGTGASVESLLTNQVDVRCIELWTCVRMRLYLRLSSLRIGAYLGLSVVLFCFPEIPHLKNGALGGRANNRYQNAC